MVTASLQTRGKEMCTMVTPSALMHPDWGRKQAVFLFTSGLHWIRLISAARGVNSVLLLCNFR